MATAPKRPATSAKPRARKPAPKKKGGGGRRFFRFVLACCGIALAGGLAVLAYLWPRCSGAACPNVAALRDYTPPQASAVYDADGRVVARLAPEQRTVVPLRQIPARVSGAFLAVEDKRFYQHHGVDWRRAAGALARDIKTLRYNQGFSTVTMQLARNVFPEQLTRAKTLRRKLWEITIARRIEKAFGKDEILELYLNQIYLGEGLYGVEAAAEGYFGKPAARLSLAESAMLAALPKAPSYYSPRRNPEAALRRRNVVLGLMADAGVVTPQEAERARAEPLRLAPPAEAGGAAPYFVAAVRQELRDRMGADAERQGLRVYTSLDRGMQSAAEAQLVRQIAAIERGAYGRWRHASCSAGKQVRPDQCLQGLFVALDPNTGDIRALVGGRDYALSQFDRVRQARRQAGSSFKPIVYAAAIAAGMPISTPLVGPGAQDVVEGAGGYRPADHVADSVTLDMRGSLRVSSNRAAVAVGERVGAGQVVELAHRMGITTSIKAYPSTFLGAADVMPLQMVATYAAFTNGGTAVAPRLIRRITDAQGRVLYAADTQRHYALSPSVAFLTNSLMRDVVDHGTGIGARGPGGLPWNVPAAGKTGTTNEAADVWFIGVTPDVVAGVWLGFDRPQSILGDASGGGLAAPVWGRVMGSWYKGRPVPAPWAVPADVTTRRIDGESGQLATPACPAEHVRDEFYQQGTEPTQTCPLHPDTLPAADGIVGTVVRGIGDLLDGSAPDTTADGTTGDGNAPQPESPAPPPARVVRPAPRTVPPARPPVARPPLSPRP
jgi:penicillin-binding protein 1A